MAPGFSAMVVAILALGIGASTAFFSVVDAILLQPLSVDRSGRIVAIQTAWPAKGQVSPRVSGGDFVDLRAAARSFSALAVYTGGQLGVQIRGKARFTRTFRVDPSFFPVLSVPAMSGRLPRPNDADEAHTAVVTSSLALANWNSIEPGGTLDVENRGYTSDWNRE
jgi:putative ABC transport system permease protein